MIDSYRGREDSASEAIGTMRSKSNVWIIGTSMAASTAVWLEVCSSHISLKRMIVRFLQLNHSLFMSCPQRGTFPLKSICWPVFALPDAPFVENVERNMLGRLVAGNAHKHRPGWSAYQAWCLETPKSRQRLQGASLCMTWRTQGDLRIWKSRYWIQDTRKRERRLGALLDDEVFNAPFVYYTKRKRTHHLHQMLLITKDLSPTQFHYYL